MRKTSLVTAGIRLDLEPGRNMGMPFTACYADCDQEGGLANNRPSILVEGRSCLFLVQ
jgi:hypothetical protein